jgi:2-polyprenyl-3-methyl-5-hydroxy-6-metoxy-1,4-benzoquinol methylase
MRAQLLDYLRCPVSGASLELFPFEAVKGPGGEDIKFGLLKSRTGSNCYPVLGGVPSLVPDSFPRSFKERFARQIEQIAGQDAAVGQAAAIWSFSDEWAEFFAQKLTRTWGWTVEQRVAMLQQETQLGPEAFNGALVCDAGCGNGQLTEAIASLGATVIGLDYSTSVFQAEAHRRSDRVHFVRGDLAAAPFVGGLFDVVVSNGVLHHTPDTRTTFERVAELVKPDGLFYLWLYRPSREWKVRYLRLLRESLLRPVCARLPRLLRDAVVRADAAVMWLLVKLVGRNRSRTYREVLIDSYDALTPRYSWRHHTPLELACWFFESGFGAPSLTHWDNPIGFGVVARKQRQADTPGVNFGRRPPLSRHYR